MAKDERKNEPGKVDTEAVLETSEIDYSPNKITQTTADIFTRFHSYVMRGKAYKGKDSALVFIIKTNKEIKVSVTDAMGKQQLVVIPENTPFRCSRVVFEQVFLQWIQEGPADRIYEWNATGKIDLTQKNPFDLEVIKTEIDPCDSMFFCNEKDLAKAQKIGPAYES